MPASEQAHTVTAVITPVEVRPCTSADLDALLAYDHGCERAIEELRFRQQHDGETTFLTAWHGKIPVAHCDIRWGSLRDPAVQAALPACPEIASLLVFPDEYQHHGIGTAVIGAASRLVVECGFDDVGIAVGNDNPAAARLYRRLGFQSAGIEYDDSWTYRDGNGVERTMIDRVSFLVHRPYRTLGV